MLKERKTHPAADSATPAARGTGSESRALSVKDNRRAYNRALEADKIRTRMNGIVIVRELKYDLDELGAIASEAKDKGRLTEDEGRAKLVRIGALKIRVDAHFKKLAKIVPDLRSMELGDKDGNNPFAPFAEAIMRAASAAGTVMDQDPERDVPQLPHQH